MSVESVHVVDAAPDRGMAFSGGPRRADPGARLAAAVTSLTESMEEELLPRWVSLTGLQVLFLKKVARGGPVTRTELMKSCQTSRSAAVPGLASLLQRDFLREAHDGMEFVLTIGTSGIDLLTEIDRVRAEWVLRAMADARRDMRGADLDRAADLLERLLATTVRP